jgi:hypothetical protein
MKKEINNELMEDLKAQANKKAEDLKVVQSALEFAFSKGCFSKFEDISIILKSFNNLR